MANNFEDTQMEDEEILLQNHSQWYDREESSSELRKRLYYPLPTWWLVISEISCIFLYAIFVFVPFEMPRTGELPLTPYQLKAGVGVFLMMLTVGFYRLRNIFHRRARRRGYLKLYRQTRIVSKIPPISWAMHVSVIALVSTLWPPGHDSDPFAPVNVLQISVAVIGSAVVAALIYYMVVVIRHNRRKLLPDAAAFRNPDVDLPEASMDEQTEKKLLDDQAAYIRHLLEQNRSLARKLRRGSAEFPGANGFPAQTNKNTLSGSEIGARERLTLVETEGRTSLSSSNSSNSVEDSNPELVRLQELLAMERSAASSYQDIIAKQRIEIERLQTLHESTD